MPRSTFPLIGFLAGLVLIACFVLGCARGFTVMHTTEIVATTAYADRFGHKILPPKTPWWFVPTLGAVGCGMYRYVESGAQMDRTRKYGLDLTGILFNEVLEKL